MSERGTASFEFLITVPLLLFLFFGGIDYYVTLIRYQQVEQVKETYLDRIRIEGGISLDLKEEIIARLEDMNFSDIEITGDVQNAPGDESYKKVRLIGSLAPENMVEIKISAKPRETPFALGKLIGGETVDGDFAIFVKGEALSEYVP